MGYVGRQDACRVDDGGYDEPGNKVREYFFQAERAALSVAAFAAGHDDRHDQADRHDHESPGQLRNGRQAAGGVAVRIAGGDDGRRVVDGRAGPHAEASVAHAHEVTQKGKDKYSGDVEQENRRNGKGHVLFLGFDDRRHGGDSRAAADGRAGADEGRRLKFQTEQPADGDGYEKGCRQGADHDRHRFGSRIQHMI